MTTKRGLLTTRVAAEDFDFFGLYLGWVEGSMTTDRDGLTRDEEGVA